MTVLVLGAGGMLGRALLAQAPAAITVRGITHAECDITNADAVAAVLDEVAPAWVINAAAYTAVDRAETDRALAHAVNATAVGMLGAHCAARGVRVMHVSTDYVFDGAGRTAWREDDATNPLSWYGRTKREGEQALQASGAMQCVVRTQWLFGPGGRSFPRTMWERASRGETTRVVHDQWGRPTYTPDLAAALWMLVGAETEGLVHVANAGEATWYAVAQRVFAARNREALLTPCTTAEYPVAATRPVYGVLDLSHATSLGIVLPPWEQGIDRFLTTIDAPL